MSWVNSYTLYFIQLSKLKMKDFKSEHLLFKSSDTILILNTGNNPLELIFQTLLILYVIPFFLHDLFIKTHSKAFFPNQENVI